MAQRYCHLLLPVPVGTWETGAQGLEVRWQVSGGGMGATVSDWGF